MEETLLKIYTIWVYCGTNKCVEKPLKNSVESRLREDVEQYVEIS